MSKDEKKETLTLAFKVEDKNALEHIDRIKSKLLELQKLKKHAISFIWK